MTSHRNASRRSSLELTTRRKTLIYSVLVLTWLSGVAWLLLHYFLTNRGEFGTEPNPLEFWMLALHGACAFVVLWLTGWLWTTHIAPWWRSHGRRRASGVVMIAFSVVLILSGYLLYYGSGDTFRDWTAIVHWIVGLAAAIPMLVHGLRSGRYRRP